MAEQALEQYNIHEAKTQLSRIIERVEQGAEVVISRSGKPGAGCPPAQTVCHPASFPDQAKTRIDG